MTDTTPRSAFHLSDDDPIPQRPASLSPAAQAVLDAAEDAYLVNYSEFYNCANSVAAAALRAVARNCEFADASVNETVAVVRVDALLAIAAELEGGR